MRPALSGRTTHLIPCLCDIFVKTLSTSDKKKVMGVAVNKSVEVHAGSVDYQTFGANDAPETIMLLHATATGAWRLVPLAARLSETYRAFVPNLDGYGMSKLDCARCPDTSKTVERFLQALEIESSHLIGHSMGGLIALRVARRGRFDL